jgi:hypothetical protein
MHHRENEIFVIHRILASVRRQHQNANREVQRLWTLYLRPSLQTEKLVLEDAANVLTDGN